MKKKTLTFLIILFIGAGFIHAQTWVALGKGINNQVSALLSYDSVLYAGGAFDSAGGAKANNIAQWNGTSWTPLGAGVNGSVNALALYKGKLYAGGSFDSAGGMPALNIAEWDGSNWHALGAGVNSLYAVVNALMVYNSELCVGGNFDSAGGMPANSVAKWNGSGWSTMGAGMPSDKGIFFVSCFGEYNNMLYAGGQFDTAGGIPTANFAQWNGTAWDSLKGDGKGSGAVYAACSILSLNVYNGNLIIGANYTLNINDISQWNGTAWDSLGGGIESNGYVSALTVNNGNLYIGGAFNMAGHSPAHSIAQWNGTSWNSNMNGGITMGAGVVKALAVYNSDVYAGGQFTAVGGVPANNVAKWTTPTSVNNISDNGNELKVYPNPSNGVFTIQTKNEELRAKSAVEVYNILGQQVYSNQLLITNYSLLINLDSQPNGVYLYRILSANGGLMGQGKLVIQR